MALIRDATWDAAGESLWSVLSKLSAANYFSISDLRKSFIVNSDGTSFGRRAIRSCSTLEGLCTDTVLASTNLTTESLAWTVPGTFLVSAVAVCPQIRICPRCAELGYHSALHQIELFSHCPWHREELTPECPDCQTRTEYELGSVMATNPGCCIAGHTLIEATHAVCRRPACFTRTVRQTLSKLTAATADLDTKLSRPSATRLRLLLDDVAPRQPLSLLRRECNDRSLKTRLRYTQAQGRRIRTNRYSFALRPRLTRGARREVFKTLVNMKTWQGEIRRRPTKRGPLPDLLLPARNRAIDLAGKDIASGFLKNHGDCWCLADKRETITFDLGISCVWRTAYEIWGSAERLKHWTDATDPMQSFLNSLWLGVFERFLAQRHRGWMRVADVALLKSVCERLTRHYLVRQYAVLVNRLVLGLLDYRPTEVLYDTNSVHALPSPPISAASYSLAIDNRKNEVTLHIDDDEVDLVRLKRLSQTNGHDAYALAGCFRTKL